MASAQAIEVADFIDRRQLSLFQFLVVAICFLVVAIDGFDATVMGFLASSIRTEWGLTPTQLSPLFAASLFGLLAGAIIFGPLSDRFGRKTILLLCVALLAPPVWPRQPRLRRPCWLRCAFSLASEWAARCRTA